MRKDAWHYILKLTIRDFLESANEVQRQAFQKRHPNFDYKPSVAELYVTMHVRLEQIIGFMKKEQIGYFGRVQA